MTVEVFNTFEWKDKKADYSFKLHMDREFRKGNNYNPCIIIQNKEDNGIETAIELTKL